MVCMIWTEKRWRRTPLWYKPGLDHLLWLFYLSYGIYYVSLSCVLWNFSDTHALWPVFFPHCANISLNLALKPIVRLLLCVTTIDSGNHVKSIMLLIIITEVPWRLEVHNASHSPFSPYRPVPVQQLWIHRSCSQSRPVVLCLWSLLF